MIRGLARWLAAARTSNVSEAVLTEALYQQWFIDWRAPADLSAQAAGDDHFTARLAHAAGPGTFWDPGWRVTGRTPTHAFVTDGAVQLFADARREVSPKDPRTGADVKLKLPCARGCATPGFFLLVSPLGRAPRVHDKLYLNLTPKGGEAVVRALRGLKARFEVKVANAPGAYGRRDSGVVYVDPAHRLAVAHALLRWSRRPGLFRAQVPPMTLRLGRGIAAAESHPSDGEGSFGEERCRLVARALQAAARDARPLAHHLRAVFGAAGLDASAPWARTARR